MSRARAAFAPLPRAAGLGAGLALLGAWPALALGGALALWGLLAGIGTSLCGWALGRLPHALVRPGPDALLQAALAGLGVRLLGTLALALPALLAQTPWPRSSFAAALVVSYLALLALEVADLGAAARGPGRPTEGPSEPPSAQAAVAERPPEGAHPR